LYLDQTALPNIIGDYRVRETNVSAYTGFAAVNSSDKQKSPVVLFLRGDPTLYTYKKVCESSTTKTDILLKNPLVMLEHGGDVLSVQFNTIDVPDTVKNCNSVSGTWERANVHKVGIKGIFGRQSTELNKKWFMVSVVIQETTPSLSLGSRNSTRCSIYITGKLKTSQTVKGRQPPGVNATPINAPVRQPTGNFYVNKVITQTVSGTNTNYSLDIATDGSTSTRDGVLMMANLSYFNYVMDEAELGALFNKGFSRKPAPSAASQLATQFDGSNVNDVSQTFDSPMLEIAGGV
jgi:hypothetical protein